MIAVVQLPLAEIEADAVVRPVRTDFTPVSAAARDLGVLAGAYVEERLLNLGSLPVGGAVMTPAGDLPCDFLIHVVVMSDEEPQTSVSVRKALQNGLRRAGDMGIESLALPPLGLGAGLAEPEESLRALTGVLLDHIDDGQPPLDLTIAVVSAYDAELLGQVIEDLVRERGVG